MADDFKRAGDEFGTRYTCPCCDGDPPGKRDRGRRRARHRLKRETEKLLRAELNKGAESDDE